jgi:hypothetical protein
MAKTSLKWLDCDHFEILNPPWVSEAAATILACAAASP